MDRIYVPNLELGDKVFIDFSRYSTVKVEPAKVIERLKSDAIKVETEAGEIHTFLRSNRLRGYGNGWNCPRLITAEQAKKLQHRQEEQQLERKLNSKLAELAKLSAHRSLPSEIGFKLDEAKQALQDYEIFLQDTQK